MASVTSQHLLWLCHWQVDIHSKWRLASAPFRGKNNFREVLDPILVENKDRQKVLPSIHGPRLTSADHPFILQTLDLMLLNISGPISREPTVRTNLDSMTEADSHFRPSSHFGGQKIGPFANLSDCHPRLPIGGRLNLFMTQWEKQHWILRCYRQ